LPVLANEDLCGRLALDRDNLMTEDTPAALVLNHVFQIQQPSHGFSMSAEGTSKYFCTRTVLT